jgi:hypothetical protein
MCALGDPVYNRIRLLNKDEVEGLSLRDIFRNYMALEVRFSHPEEVKYPGIPQNVDDTTTIYPRSGDSIITGYEYLQAKLIGCEFSKINAVAIPYRLGEDFDKESSESVENFESFLIAENVESSCDYIENAPFIEIEKIIQEERRKYVKNSFGNLFYKNGNVE